MYHVTIYFQPTGAPIDGRLVTAKGLHGLLFKALKEADPQETDWLHAHDSPKPFSLAPLYAEGGLLAGLRVGTISHRVAQLVVRAWDWHRRERHVLSIGRQRLRAGDVVCVAGPEWADLVDIQPVVRVDLEFLSPTTFRQGPGHLPLPVPYNVFYWPWRVWQTYAPPASLPDDWLEWCRDDVFVTAHRLETVPVRITGPNQLGGFVGQARFETHKGSRDQLRLLHALAMLATYTGVGHKTTMGLGAVALQTAGQRSN